ncbi:hypothetical protein BDW02DRAFT_125113 [Decorospora gaudefroyi]|uniref:Uncharacterized protein n=1 Tax=Decorospora gaudefroyi TaxID=184978 RepID=A0A6A5K1I5_9PLEO|nr:hypothetical protein BDW02DRAFT_125113 [Decorospora gaudefroyi]
MCTVCVRILGNGLLEFLSVVDLLGSTKGEGELSRDLVRCRYVWVWDGLGLKHGVGCLKRWSLLSVREGRSWDRDCVCGLDLEGRGYMNVEALVAGSYFPCYAEHGL